MPALIDLRGQTFGRWRVVARDPASLGIRNVSPRWLCVCACGYKGIAIGKHLRAGRSRSCGCLIAEATVRRCTKHGHSRRGKSTRSFRIWAGMRSRCWNPNVPHFRNYGGRGISVCERWESFENFLADMGEPPAGMTLDRVNNEGNYEPSNCRWATYSQQARNRRPGSGWWGPHVLLKDRA